MEAHEVCARQISTKLHDICSQYNLLELGHGANPHITFLVDSTPIDMEWFKKYIIERKHLYSCDGII
jgi:hypothetical protein